MQTAVEVHMAQKYRVSDKNDKEIFDFLKQNFGCNRKVYNLCVGSLYAQLEKAGYQAGDDIPGVKFPKITDLKKEFEYLKKQTPRDCQIQSWILKAHGRSISQNATTQLIQNELSGEVNPEPNLCHSEALRVCLSFTQR